MSPRRDPALHFIDASDTVGLLLQVPGGKARPTGAQDAAFHLLQEVHVPHPVHGPDPPDEFRHEYKMSYNMLALLCAIFFHQCCFGHQCFSSHHCSLAASAPWLLVLTNQPWSCCNAVLRSLSLDW